MTYEENMMMVFFVVMPIMLVFYAIYFSSDRLKNCYFCNREISIQAHRGWVKANGKNHPVCTKCCNKHNI